MNETVKKPTVSKSFFGNYFYHTRYKPLYRDGVEVGKEVVGQKTDVTDSVAPLIDSEIIEFLRYAKDTYGLELLDPEPKEEDGQKYLYGVNKKTGHGTYNEFVEEWRQS